MARAVAPGLIGPGGQPGLCGVEQPFVPVDQQPGLTGAEDRGQGAQHRSGAAAEIGDGHRLALAPIRANPLQQPSRAGGKVGGFAQCQPIGGKV